MDIASASMAMSQTRLMQEVSTAVLAKALNGVDAQAVSEVNMIDAVEVADPTLGEHIDMYA